MLAIEDVLSQLMQPQEQIKALKMMQSYFKILEKEPLEGIEVSLLWNMLMIKRNCIRTLISGS